MHCAAIFIVLLFLLVTALCVMLWFWGVGGPRAALRSLRSAFGRRHPPAGEEAGAHTGAPALPGGWARARRPQTAWLGL